MRLNEPAAISAAPNTSSRGRAPVRSSGRIDSRAPPTRSGVRITLIPKPHRHEYSVVSQPPTIGPKATDAPATAPHAANAVCRSGPEGNVVDRTDSVAGIIIEAPMPSMSASPTNSVGTDVDTVASSEPTPNTVA